MERTTSPQDPPVILELNNQLFREVGAIPETITRISERPQHNDYYFDDSNLQNTSYPYSVSEDYLQYQLWDTLQAFASSMTSALATEAVLKGAGVGDQVCTYRLSETTETLMRLRIQRRRGCDVGDFAASSINTSQPRRLWILDRIGGPVVSDTVSSELDYDCKKWRLVADIMNDLAFFIDLLSPALSGSFFICACTSSLLRAVVGVAGGATRTAIVQHQARRNNLADVASKDGSQETMVNVTALISSLIMLPLVSGKHTLIWFLFMAFTGVHLYANYRAVRSLNMETLNLKRATILIRSWLSSRNIPSVQECNRAEPLFYSFGKRYLGCSLYDLLSYQHKVPSAHLRTCDDYTLLYDTQRNIGWVALTNGAPSLSPLRAVFDTEIIAFKKETSEKQFDEFISEISSKGWRAEGPNLGYDEWTYTRK
ncbi:hypothetical protein Y032_0674g1416 [Ancylostoma ceylanicum]|uniref:Protein root UVB sensitive/RUS domain-containing protein n=2 Tax=Ancylostoma ceylanicum TaxID=53326 RepID=A0A016WJG1_9BILA|nr:hypothetical protein Y032_0674g1416 [Ancylostoma ceylanicum]